MGKRRGVSHTQKLPVISTSRVGRVGGKVRSKNGKKRKRKTSMGQ